MIKPTIRNIEETDLSAVMEINEKFVEKTSPLNIEKLSVLLHYADYAKVTVLEETIAGFLLAIPHSKIFDNDNYKWFSSRYENFIYIDRIVIAAEFAGKKVGSQLYENLVDYAKANNLSSLACEINVFPPNQLSMDFHKKHGFSEVGTRRLDGNEKVVSMQLKSLL